jgi:uncharacterized Tic20 family protein
MSDTSDTAKQKSAVRFKIDLTFWHIAIFYLICCLAGLVNLVVGVVAFICVTALLVTVLLLMWNLADKEADTQDDNRTLTS